MLASTREGMSKALLSIANLQQQLASALLLLSFRFSHRICELGRVLPDLTVATAVDRF